MMQPMWCMCGARIKANEHYFIFRGGRSVCIRCKRNIKHIKNNHGGVICNRVNDNSNEEVR